MLEPQLLIHFLHVVDTGSLSAASRVAHLSQPALSRQIQQLERELGTELFDRTGRGMRPTLDGKRLEARVRPLLRQLDGLSREFSQAPISGPVSLAVSPSIGMAWTAAQVDAFRRRYSEAELRVSVALSGPMGGAVERGKFDLGLLYSPVHGRHLVTAELWKEQTYLLTPTRSPFARRRHISCREALSAPLLVPSSEHGIRALLEEKSRELGQPLNWALQVDSMQLSFELVRLGVGHLVLTERALSDLGAQGLVALPIRRPSLQRTAQLVSTETALLRPVVRALWEALLEDAQRSGGTSGRAGALRRGGVLSK